MTFFAVIMGTTRHVTFADANGVSETFVSDGARYVTFYDDGDKLIVKTEAHTVREALERADIELNDGDKVEPGLEAEINSDNSGHSDGVDLPAVIFPDESYNQRNHHH